MDPDTLAFETLVDPAATPPPDGAGVTAVEIWKLLLLNPGFQSRVSHPDTTGIPQVNYSTNQRQFPSTPADVSYLTKTPITTKPIVSTNKFVHDLASLRSSLHQQNKLIFCSSHSLTPSSSTRQQFRLPTVTHNKTMTTTVNKVDVF